MQAVALGDVNDFLHLLVYKGKVAYVIPLIVLPERQKYGLCYTTKNSRLAAAAEPEGGRLNSNYSHERTHVKAGCR